MASSIQNISLNNTIIDIPEEYLEYGKTLLIEKYYELFVDGYHLSKPSRFIRQIHGLCLLDTQQQGTTVINSTHQSQSTIDTNQLQFIIEFPPECLNAGKIVTIEKFDSNDEEETKECLGHFDDLYNIENFNKSLEKKQISIRIPKENLERGKTIVIQKKKYFVRETNDYQKEQLHHLTNNSFSKRDHLQSKNMMEITIAIPPEFFDDGQKLSFKKEDSNIVQANFPSYRQTKSNNDQSASEEKNSIEKLLSNQIWNPIYSDNQHFIELHLDFNDRPDIQNIDQLKISLDGNCFRVETNDQQNSNLYQQIQLPESIQFDQIKYLFNQQNHSLNIKLPLH